MITPQQIENLKSLLQSGADTEFFFSSIKSAEWLPALLDNGFFDSPPEPERGDTWVRFPPWPQSRYLVRVAAQVPEVAVKTALHIPLTENARVNDDILGVALAAPPTLAAKLLPRIAQWVDHSNLRWMANDVADVIAHIAAGEDFKDTLNLLQSLIAFTPDPEKAEKARIRGAGGMIGWGLEPRSRLELHDYKKILATAVPPLLRNNPLETLGMLAGVLNRFINEKMERDAPPGYDGSVYWRPSIAEHGQNPDHKQISYLVSALREAGETTVGNAWINIDCLLGVVRQHPWHIFKRLELHWARVFRAQVDPSILKRLLLTADYFFSGNFDLEYGLLFREAFGILSPEEQTQIFQWVEQGPRADDLAWMTKALSGEPAPEEIVARRIAHWRVNRLFWIRDALPSAWRACYDQWVSQSSEPEHPGFHVWSGGGEVGVMSPLTAEALHAMALSQQLDFLRTWNPGTPSWNGPMKEGLAGTLQAVVKAHPSYYFQIAAQFIGLEPPYVSGLLRGFSEGLKGQAVDAWQPFWTFARWILDQPDPEVEIQDEFTGRPRQGRCWQSCRLELARFVDAITKGDLAKLPLAERASIWQLTEALTHDPSPAPADEARDDKSSMDPLTLSLNTVRGEAVHSIFSYIRWVRSHLPTDTQANQTLDDVPEARAVLESLLDPRIEPTLTVRSVFGANIAYLAYCAETWLREHLVQIFPHNGHENLGIIAWNTYIRFSRASAKTVSLMHAEYAAAIARMSPEPDEEQQYEDTRVCLGEHLVVNYWWGQLDFEKTDDLLAAFFARAPEWVRAQIIAFAGRSVAELAEAIPPDIRERLVKFWNWRVQVATAVGGSEHQQELASFSWWFDSKKFDDIWAAKQMVVALELSHATESQFLWMKRFAEIAEKYPAEAVRGLELTLLAVQQTAGEFWEDDQASTIFKAVRNLGDQTIMQRARRAQNLLLGMGKSQFLHALPLADAQ